MMLGKLTIARVLGTATLLFSSIGAAAGVPTVLKLADGNNAGPLGKNDGPGAEQATVTSLVVNEKRYVVTVWMSSQVNEGDRPYQCKCTSIEMDPLAGPRVVADAVQLTDNNGNRPCNHPKIANNGKDLLWVYGTNDPNQNNVQAYVQGLDYMCNTITDRLRISNNNGNDGAADIGFSQMGEDGTSYWMAGYLENNERSRAVGLTTTGTGRGMAITETFDNVVVDPANIGRPSLAQFGPDRTLFCSSNGNNRPPEIGVRCAMLNTRTGERLWSEVIANSEPNATPPIYYNQPQVAVGDNGRMFVQVERSNGGGRDNNHNRNGRGSTVTEVYALLPNDQGPRKQAEITNIGLNQVHAAVCTGGYGEDNALHAAIFDASITGTGLAAAQLARFNVTARAVEKVGTPRSLGAYNGDSGYLANLYGNNPNTQGRDFVRCIGDVPNPGFGVNNGYQPDVASYFVFGYAGRVNGEEKNSLFVSFLPAHVPEVVAPVQHALGVRVTGDGLGSVSSSPLGIDNCASTEGCQVAFDQGTVVTLTATPAEGSTFVAWSGACAGGGECMVRLDRPQSVTATFTRVGAARPTVVALSVQVGGNGAGTIVSNPAGIDCADGTCTANFDIDTVVTLTAEPDAGSAFAGWTGGCTGTAPCVVTLDVARSLNATFNLNDPLPNGDPINPPPGDTDDPQPQADGPSGSYSDCAATPVQNGGGAWVLLIFACGFITRRRGK